MQSLHYSHTLLSDDLYNECSFQIEFIDSYISTISIAPDTYNDIYEIVEALDAEFAEHISGGSVFLDDGIVKMTSSIPFRPVIHTQGTSVLNRDPLLQILGFNQLSAFSTVQMADSQPVISFFRNSFNESFLERISAMLQSANGLHGFGKNVNMSIQREHNISLNFLTTTEYLHLKSWYETAVKGRKVRYFFDDTNYLDFFLSNKSQKGSMNIFSSCTKSQNHWTAKLYFIEV